jgi:hypothetical protein
MTARRHVSSTEHQMCLMRGLWENNLVNSGTNTRKRAKENKYDKSH